ncbi:MAG: twin-arginine translocase subunit TatC [Ilumatobacter sp.]|uniref:twin-arginine translocase subunit TatC n=1 Tax=Ilumatobacter sp. TaxID=1967498 RepID=UPI00260B38FA|nr:twin-arginine translocase subunit TatC [Ilumatobacter sp.]MDJ0771459.1 twin-arginine translocase subunit TatC [Ilumatobacter sp.]
MSRLRFRRKQQPDPASEQMTLMEHLAELRMRIIRSALAIVIGSILVIAFYDTVMGWLLEPYGDLCRRQEPEYCGRSFDEATGEVMLFNPDPIEGFSTRLRIGFYGGIVLALPVLLWQLWKFIVPALHKSEKRYALGFVSSSIVLFLAGGFIAFTTLERALEFLISWAGEDVDPLFQVQAYVRLVTLMVVAFGVGFTIPVMLVFLQLIGVVTPQTLLGGWRYAIVGTFFVAAAITPSGDPISLLALSVPMVILFFVAILIGRLAQRRRQRAEA